MALVTVQRSPSPTHTSAHHEDEEGSELSGHSKKGHRSQRNLKKLVKTVNTIRFVNRLSKLLVKQLHYRFSESYFTIKGAALILPKSDKLPQSKKRTRLKSSVQVTDIQTHLQRMFHELRADDTIQVAIKLESSTNLSRYLAIVVTEGTDSKQEGVIIGFHCTDELAYIGLVLAIYQNTEISLDGDGGFRILTGERPHIFKPVSIQAMWSAIMSLNKVCAAAKQNNQIANGPTHSWLSHYTDKSTREQSMLNEWDMLDDLMVTRAQSPGTTLDEDMGSVEKQIRVHLRDLLTGSDLEDVTSYMLRMELEKQLNRPLKQYRSFIDQEMLLIIRQLDAASQIFDFVYLGSEWNAGNLQELQTNGVGYILNVTREIDNFFPGMFKYMNIRLYDDESSDLMKYWENTHGFICKARDNNSKILVHCKMGVSRSASTVIAFAMKEYEWSLEHALEVIEGKRSVIKPNDSFMQQLQTYEGILVANRHRARFNKETEVQHTKGDQQQNTDELSSRCDSAAATNNFDNTSNLDFNSGILVTDSDDLSDTDGRSSDSSCTTNYSLDEDSDNVSLSADDGGVVGLHYGKLDDRTPRNNGHSKHTDTEATPVALPPNNPCPQANLPSSSTTTQPVTTSQPGAAEDVSVCYGLVRKTKERIVGGQTSQQMMSPVLENVVPVTPGTVRKVLGEIEHKSELDGTLSRSASLKLNRRKTYEDVDSIQRSASMRLKRASAGTQRPSSLVTHSTGGEDSSSTSVQKCRPNTIEKVQFSIGGSNLDNNSDSSLEDILQRGAEKPPTPPQMAATTSAKSCQSRNERPSQPSAPIDHILRVSSKPCLPVADDDSRPNLPVKTLVCAFEDIGVATRNLARPLTIHVDSFSSDPFVQTGVRSDNMSPLKRSQSLQVFTPPEPQPPKKPDRQFNIRTVNSSSTQPLRPYWRIKMDNAKKLIHSFSSATVSSKDPS